MLQQLFIIGLCLVVMACSLGIAGWQIVSGQVFKQGVEAIFTIIVCLTLAAAFSFIPCQAWMNGSLQRMLGMRARAARAAGDEHEVEVFVDDTLPEHEVPRKTFFLVWFWLLALTAVEVLLAYIHVFSTHVMLGILMALSLVKAGLIVAYFMHMKFENRAFVLSVVPCTMVVITLLCIFFPDSFRILDLGVN